MIITDNLAYPLSRHADRRTLNAFRTGVYTSLTQRSDALFELADAVACSTSPVADVARLSLESGSSAATVESTTVSALARSIPAGYAR